jgi:hypothetical protein
MALVKGRAAKWLYNGFSQGKKEVTQNLRGEALAMKLVLMEVLEVSA